ncbi:hypothetical protein D3C81_1742490 [compost metagenome]
MLGFGPLVAEAAYQHFIDRHQRRVRQHGEESRIRLCQRHFEGGVVNRLHAQRVGLLLALRDIGRIHNMHVARVAGVG